MKNRFLASGSIIAAVFASLCCIGPLVFVGFGIGSVASFSRFDVLRPYLILASVLLLVPAFYLAYRKREVKCEDGSCKIESAGKWNKLSVWLSVVVTFLSIAFPYFNIRPDSAIKNKTEFKPSNISTNRSAGSLSNRNLSDSCCTQMSAAEQQRCTAIPSSSSLQKKKIK